MDWNNDGRIDAHDYVHYKSVIDTGSSSSSGSNHTSNSSSSSGSATGVKWFVAIIIIYVILKLMGLD